MHPATIHRRLRRLRGRRRHGHSKIYILYITYIEYLADMVQWQSENKSTTQRAARHVLSYELVLNTNTHSSGIIPTKYTTLFQ